MLIESPTPYSLHHCSAQIVLYFILSLDYTIEFVDIANCRFKLLNY